MSKSTKRKRPAAAGKQERTVPAPQPCESVGRRAFWQPLWFAVAAVVASGYVFSQVRNFFDADIFYHLGHARVYATQGPFVSEFPWVTSSVIRTYAADIWYGFHLLLIPFVYLPSPALQMKAAGAFSVFALLLMFYFAMRRSRLQYPYLWPFLLLFPAALRLTMTRPHIISMGLAVLLFSFALSGGIWSVFFISLAMSFIHLSLFWLAIVVAGAVALVKWRTEKVFEGRKLAAVLGGLIVGWLLRPNPLGAAKLVYVQVLQLMLVKRRGELNFPNELYPISAENLFKVFGYFTALWLIVAALFLATVFLRRITLSPSKRSLLWSSLALSVLFFEMTLLMSMRSIDQWAPFAVIFIAAGASCLLTPGEAGEKPASAGRKRVVVLSLGAIFLVFMCWHSMARYQYLTRTQGIEPYRMRAAAQWLNRHSRPGEIVFHAGWNNFAELFYWNPQNYYIGGMDPIFEYAYDPARYWKADHLANNEAASQTWGTYDVGGARLEETYRVIREDFGASYLLVDKSETPTLYGYAKGDARFLRRYDDRQAAIFQLADAPRGKAD